MNNHDNRNLKFDESTFVQWSSTRKEAEMIQETVSQRMEHETRNVEDDRPFWGNTNLDPRDNTERYENMNNTYCATQQYQDLQIQTGNEMRIGNSHYREERLEYYMTKDMNISGSYSKEETGFWRNGSEKASARKRKHSAISNYDQETSICCDSPEKKMGAVTVQNTPTTKINELTLCGNKRIPITYKELTLLPTSSDIHADMDSSIQPIPISGKYASGEDYLNINFRLLREDFVRPLKDGIKEIKKKLFLNKKGVVLDIYTGVRVVKLCCAYMGVTHKIQFSVDNLMNVNWNQSKRLMQYNLLCFSKDCFETMIYGVVTRREAEELKEGYLAVRFINFRECEAYFRNTAGLMMVESSVFYEAYKHVLNGMTEMDPDRIPFQKYIVQGKGVSCVPKYLDCEDPWYNLNRPLGISQRKIQILKDNDWPTAEKTKFNGSQLSAFKAALTNEFVVIQGPPGTGKTYVGVRIADALLRNKKYWNRNSKFPMLVVSYKNLALDQFLEGLLNLGHTNIIRVGGNVSEKLRPYSLSQARRNSTLKEKNYFMKKMESRRINQAKQLHAQSTREKFHNTVINGQFIPSYKYRRLMKPNQFQMFQDIYQDCKELKISIFDVFLEMGNITHGDIKFPCANNAKEEPISTDLSTFWNNSVNHINEYIDNIISNDVSDMVVSKSNHDANSNVTLLDVKIEDGKLDNDDSIEFVLEGSKSVQLTNDIRPTMLMTKLEKQKLEYEDRHRLVNMEMQRVSAMTEEEVELVKDPWTLESQDRWRLYKYWLGQLEKGDVNILNQNVLRYGNTCEQIGKIRENLDKIIMKKAQVIAMTTTGAAKNRNLLKKVNPKIVIVEEAAEVLEAHVITSLTPKVEHLILIGDHKQLKPKPSVHKLAVEYNLDISLFERMVNNGIELHTLKIQHRMRPEISSFLKHIYPDLINAASVQNYPNVTGVGKNIFFISHKEMEDEDVVSTSKSNQHEAKFLKSFCNYLLQQGYEPSQITILSGYLGQVKLMQVHMPKSLFEGIRISSVDNFQGEENDIVLLSLVRSNEKGQIGFMKNENRVCVCLSRAKIGLYVIGNFDMFVNQQKDTIWRKIIPEAESRGFYGKKLTLFCHNHPHRKTEVSNEEDFVAVPDGGCSKSCNYRLKCGHSCKKKCHIVDAEHVAYECQEICEQNNCENEEHYCLERCHFPAPCRPCNIKLQKFVPSCFHYQQIPCSVDPENFNCKERCEKMLLCGHRCIKICSAKCDDKSCRERVQKILPCGHSERFPCNEAVIDVFCQVKCGEKLLCEHPCFGSCGSCKQGRLHVQCNMKCNRVLMCGHICKDKCTKICPPCPLKCTNICTHRKCKSECGNPCTPCKEKCEYRCEHTKCRKKCFETCDRDPCSKPCRVKLKCGHRCIGLCGEVCPELCRICDKSQVQKKFFGSEHKPDATFLDLYDCGHMLEVNVLDHWMNLKDDNDNIIKLKECPRCATPIQTTPRYSKIIKQYWQDIEKIKKILLGGEVDKSRKLKLYETLKSMDALHGNLPISSKGDYPGLNQYNYEDFKNYSERCDKKIYYEYLKPENGYDTFVLADSLVRASKNTIRSVENKINLFKQWIDLAKVMVDSGNFHSDIIEWKIVIKDLKIVKKFIMRGAMNDEQQFTDAAIELKRLQLFLNILIATEMLKKVEEGDGKNHDISRLAIIFKRVIGGKKLANIDGHINEMKEMAKRGTFKSKITDNETIQRVKTIGLIKGQWCKCPNGHFYAIGRHDGAVQRGKCPECKKNIGGEQLRLATTNQHAGKFEDSNHAAVSDVTNIIYSDFINNMDGRLCSAKFLPKREEMIE